MNGLKEGMEYLVEQSKPEFKEHEGYLFSDKKMYPVHKEEPLATPLNMYTLTSLIDYINSEADKLPEHMIIHVESPTKVSLLSSLNEDRCREVIAVANAMIPEFSFGRFYDAEEFTICLQSRFLDYSASGQRNDKDTILKFTGTAEIGTLKQYGDDGVSQSVQIQKTTTSREEDIVPNPVYLCAYRTFHEISQPTSPFIFRIKDISGHLAAALYDADGGAWMNETMQEIKKWIIGELHDLVDEKKHLESRFTVVS